MARQWLKLTLILSVDVLTLLFAGLTFAFGTITYCLMRIAEKLASLRKSIKGKNDVKPSRDRAKPNLNRHPWMDDMELGKADLARSRKYRIVFYRHHRDLDDDRPFFGPN